MRKKLSGSGPSSPSDHITMSDGIRRRHNAGSDSSFKRNKSHDDLDTSRTPQTIEDEISRSQPAF